MSNFYNLLSKEARNYYKSIYYVENSIAIIEYNLLTPIPKENSNFVICHQLTNVFGNKSYKVNTQISDEMLNDMLRYESFYDIDKKSLKIESS